MWISGESSRLEFCILQHDLDDSKLNLRRMFKTYDSEILLAEHLVGNSKLEPNKSATQTNRYSLKSTRLFSGELPQWMNGFYLKKMLGWPNSAIPRILDNILA